MLHDGACSSREAAPKVVLQLLASAGQSCRRRERLQIHESELHGAHAAAT